jgi:HSP20 family protein
MLTRFWQPYRDLETLRRQMDRLFDETIGLTEAKQTTWMPAIEILDAGDNLIVKAQLPGIEAKDLDIQVTREAVSLSGERRFERQEENKGFFRSELRYGQFQRLIPLPTPVQNDKVQAEYKDGILHLTLPKTVEALNRVVKVNLADSADSSN